MIGLFFGSFNPIHIGHLIIANSMLEYTALKKLWFVVSPQNPFKAKNSLLEDHHRMQLVRVAIEDNFNFEASDIEFKLNKPSYTVDTLVYLYNKYPEKKFALIMGSDNLNTLHKWKNYEYILKHHKIFVYKRTEGINTVLQDHPLVSVLDVPLLNISATFIRNAIKNKKDVKYLLPESVYQYIKEMHFYEK